MLNKKICLKCVKRVLYDLSKLPPFGTWDEVHCEIERKCLPRFVSKSFSPYATSAALKEAIKNIKENDKFPFRIKDSTVWDSWLIDFDSPPEHCPYVLEHLVNSEG